MSSRNYAYHNVEYNGDGATDMWGTYGAGITNIDDPSDANFVFGENTGTTANLSFVTNDALGGVPQVVVPLNSTVSSVVVNYRYAQSDANGDIKPYIKSAGGVSRAADVASPPLYPTFGARQVTWTTDPNNNTWTVANFFATRYGTSVESEPTGTVNYWSHLNQTINFTLAAPTAVTTSATGVSSVSATLRGTVNPNQATTTYPVSYYFEYGPTAAYGTTTTPVTGNIGTMDVNATTGISGLTGNSTYHYRVVATNADNTVFGADTEFTTTSNDRALLIL